MPNYTAPVEDMMFLFDKLRNNKNYNEIKKYQEVTSELAKDILEQAMYGDITEDIPASILQTHTNMEAFYCD